MKASELKNMVEEVNQLVAYFGDIRIIRLCVNTEGYYVMTPDGLVYRVEETIII